MLAPELKEETTASAEVREVFKISKIGNIAGCFVTTGKMNRSDRVRVMRDGLPVFTGSIGSLKRNKDDVKEVEHGYECGIMLNGFNQIKAGDAIVAFQIIEIKRSIS